MEMVLLVIVLAAGMRYNGQTGVRLHSWNERLTSWQSCWWMKLVRGNDDGIDNLSGMWKRDFR